MGGLERPPLARDWSQVAEGRVEAEKLEAGPSGQRPCLQLGGRRAPHSPGFPSGSRVSWVTSAGTACVCLWSVRCVLVCVRASLGVGAHVRARACMHARVCARAWGMHECVRVCGVRIRVCEWGGVCLNLWRAVRPLAINPLVDFVK